MGALMLSVLLGTAFVSRQIWGVISDRIGGLATVMIGSAWQAASMMAFLSTQTESWPVHGGLPVLGSPFPHHPPLFASGARTVSGIEASWRNPDIVLVQPAAAWRWVPGSPACSTTLRIL